MLSKLIIHPTTKQTLLALAKQPPQGLLLVGAAGMGKLALATAWAAQFAPHARVLEPDDKGTISIAAIRDLYRETRAKRTEPLAVIIDHAEAMGSEAQNAFLKLLEEPQAQILFVLSASHSEALLPTIRSRVQQVTVLPVDDTLLREQLQTHDLPSQQLAQILFVAQGRPAIALQLAKGDMLLEDTKQRMQQAKLLLTAPVYERLVAVGEIAKNRSQCQEVLRAMLVMSAKQLKNTTDPAKLDHWLRLTDEIQHGLRQLQANGNAKTILLRLLTAY